MDMESLTGAQKRNLKHFFQEALTSQLDQDDDRLSRALTVIQLQGFSPKDLEAFDNDPRTLFNLLGDDAIDGDLQARLKDADDISSSFDWGRRDYQGFYPLFENK